MSSTQYTWTTDELSFLKDCFDGSGTNETAPIWERVSAKVNNVFHNCRTANSCKRRYKLLMMRERTMYDKEELQGKM